LQSRRFAGKTIYRQATGRGVENKKGGGLKMGAAAFCARFLKSISCLVTLFNPSSSSFNPPPPSQVFSADFEDVIGDLPTRFKCALAMLLHALSTIMQAFARIVMHHASVVTHHHTS